MELTINQINLLLFIGYLHKAYQIANEFPEGLSEIDWLKKELSFIDVNLYNKIMELRRENALDIYSGH